MELPHRKEKVDMDLWKGEIKAFKEKMEKESGNEITFEKLRDAISLVNKKRDALNRLYNARKADPAPISGRDALVISELAFFDDPARFTEKVNELCDELEERIEKGEGVAPKGTPRILITGSPQPLPSWKLHAVIEQSGAVVVCEETCTGTRYFENRVDENSTNVEEQLEALPNVVCPLTVPALLQTKDHRGYNPPGKRIQCRRCHLL